MTNKAGFITGENICIDGGMTKFMFTKTMIQDWLLN